MAETETDLTARVDALESIMLTLCELMSQSNMHTAYRLGDTLKPLQERQAGSRPMADRRNDDAIVG